MRTNESRKRLINGRLIAFEAAYRITAGIGIVIGLVRHLRWRPARDRGSLAR
jgi:hypothetical protein